MKCVYCGKEINEDLLFCSFCGRKTIPVVKEPTPAEPVEQAPDFGRNTFHTPEPVKEVPKNNKIQELSAQYDVEAEDMVSMELLINMFLEDVQNL